MPLDPHHRRTVQAILTHPAGHNIEWRNVLSLLQAVGETTEEHNDHVKVRIGDETELLRRPRGKDIDEQMVVDLRRMLTAAGITGDGPVPHRETASAAESSSRNGGAILVLNYHRAEIYLSDVVGTRPTSVLPADPHGTRRTMHHKADNPTGWYGEPDRRWYADIASALAPARQILLIGNGVGHSDVTTQFKAFLAEHNPEISDRVDGTIDTDEEDLTEGQVLALAREFYDDQLPRDHGDGRWGEK
jgi:hypothetical protein